MPAKSQYRGHKIEYNGKEWIYSDTKESTEKNHKSRPCGKCGKMETKEGHDACIGTLKNVMNACCGHGEIEMAYVQFWDKTQISGQDAINYINLNKS